MRESMDRETPELRESSPRESRRLRRRARRLLPTVAETSGAVPPEQPRFVTLDPLIVILCVFNRHMSVITDTSPNPPAPVVSREICCCG